MKIVSEKFGFLKKKYYLCGEILTPITMKRILLFLLLFMSMQFTFAQTIYIFGGENHDVYLGKFNADPYDSESIWNEYGSHGNEYNTDCIWNEYGTYGNEYSMYSPWNEYSSESPILVDKKGNSYGLFNENNHNAIVRKVCKLAKSIMSGDSDLDLGDWYNIIFNNK